MVAETAAAEAAVSVEVSAGVLKDLPVGDSGQIVDAILILRPDDEGMRTSNDLLVEDLGSISDVTAHRLVVVVERGGACEPVLLLVETSSLREPGLE